MSTTSVTPTTMVSSLGGWKGWQQAGVGLAPAVVPLAWGTGDTYPEKLREMRRSSTQTLSAPQFFSKGS